MDPTQGSMQSTHPEQLKAHTGDYETIKNERDLLKQFVLNQWKPEQDASSPGAGKKRSRKNGVTPVIIKGPKKDPTEKQKASHDKFRAVVKQAKDIQQAEPGLVWKEAMKRAFAQNKNMAPVAC